MKGCDFNLVMDKGLDSMNYKHLNNPQARIEVLKLIEPLSLVDIFSRKCSELKKVQMEEKKSNLKLYPVNQSTNQ